MPRKQTKTKRHVNESLAVDKENSISSANTSFDELFESQEPLKKTGTPRKSPASSQQQNQSPRSSPRKAKESLPMMERVTRGTGYSTGVKDFFALYEKNVFKAQTELVNFLIEASGGVSFLEIKDLRAHPDPDNNLTKIFTEEYLTQAGADYPVLPKKGRKFGQNFSAFWESLVRGCPDRLLYNRSFLDLVMDWLTTFVWHSATGFRHTAVIAVAQTIQALVAIVKRLAQEKETFSSQLSTATKQHNTSRIPSLKEKVDQASKRVEFLYSEIADFFMLLYPNSRKSDDNGGSRYRDIDDNIRAVVVASLGAFLEEDLEFFSPYLKYLVFALNDPSAKVRLNALTAFYQLFTDADKLEELSETIKYARDRLIEMALDVDIEVACQAIRALSLLNQHTDLGEPNLASVSAVICDSSEKIRFAVAPLVYSRVFGASQEEPKKTSKKKGKGKGKGSDDDETTDEQRHMSNLLSFIENSATPEYPNHIVDALWHLDVSFFTNWEMMADMLLDNESNLRDNQQALLIRVLNSAIQKATDQTHVFDAISTSDKLKYQQAFTTCLIKHLPALLAKFRTIDPVVEDLIELTNYLILEDYGSSSNKQNLVQLLEQIQNVYITATDDNILISCSKALRFLANSKHANVREVDVVIKEMSTKLQKQLDARSESSLRVSLKRIKFLFQLHKLHLDNIGEVLLQNLVNSDTQIVLAAADIAFRRIIWRVKDAVTNKIPAQTIERERDVLVRELTRLLTEGSSELQEKAFLLLTDMLILFSPNSGWEFSLKPNASLQRAMLNYFELQMQHARENANINDDDDDDQKEGEISESAARKVRLIEALARPIAYNCLSTALGAPILFANFLLCGKQADAILKLALERIRERHANEEWQVVINTLTHLHRSCQTERDLRHLSNLAMRFARSYGVLKSADPKDKKNLNITSIIIKGIDYVMEKVPERNSFFPALIKFAHKVPTFIPKLRSYCKTMRSQQNPRPERDTDAEYFFFLEELKNIRNGRPTRSTQRDTQGKRRGAGKGGASAKSRHVEGIVPRELPEDPIVDSDQEQEDEEQQQTHSKQQKSQPSSSSQQKKHRGKIPVAQLEAELEEEEQLEQAQLELSSEEEPLQRKRGAKPAASKAKATKATPTAKGKKKGPANKKAATAMEKRKASSEDLSDESSDTDLKPTTKTRAKKN